MLGNRDSTSSSVAKATILVAILFFLWLLAFAQQVPLTFDDAFNATVALNLAQGRGYGTYLGGVFVPFNPVISTGSFFIAPFSLVLRIFEPSILIVQVYSLTVTFFFFCTALIFSWRIHRYIPLALIILSAVFLLHGKTDLVPHTTAFNLPEPTYGLWFQFLGNMAGVWALIAAIMVCASPAQRRFGRLPILFVCAAFACNAKMVHALPLVVAVTTLFMCAPTSIWPSLIVAYVGILVGVRADSLMARITLGPGGFEEYRSVAKGFFTSNQRSYSDFFESPSLQGLLAMLGRIPANWSVATGYVGHTLLFLTLLAVGMSLQLFIAGKKDPNGAYMGRAVLAFGMASVAIIMWWAGIPSPPIRFLTVAAPLVTATTAIAVIAAWSCDGVSRRVTLVGIASLLVFFTLYQRSGDVRAAIRSAKAVRHEQLTVVDVVKKVAARHKRSAICGDGWWYPHEISFLVSAPESISCTSDRALQVIVPKHIFPAGVGAQGTSRRCTQTFSGVYYDVAFCRRIASAPTD